MADSREAMCDEPKPTQFTKRQIINRLKQMEQSCRSLWESIEVDSPPPKQAVVEIDDNTRELTKFFLAKMTAGGKIDAAKGGGPRVPSRSDYEGFHILLNGNNRREAKEREQIVAAIKWLSNGSNDDWLTTHVRSGGGFRKKYTDICTKARIRTAGGVSRYRNLGED